MSDPVQPSPTRDSGITPGRNGAARDPDAPIPLPVHSRALEPDDTKSGDGQFGLAADDDADLRPVNLAVGKKLLPFLRPHRAILGLGLGLVLVRTAVALVGPKLQGEVVGAITDKIPEITDRAAREAARLERVAWISALLLLVQVVLFFLSWAQNYVLSRAGQDVLFDLREKLFKHVESRAASFFQRWPVGRLVSRVANDVETISDLCTTGMIAIVGDLCTIVGVIAVLLSLNWRLAIAGLCSLPLIIGIVAGFRRPVRMTHRQNRRRMATLAAFLNERITGVRVIRAFAAEPEDRVRFDKVNEDVYQSYRRSIHLDGLFNPAIFGASALAVAALIWRGGEDLAAAQIDAATLFSFIMYVQWFYQPIRDIADKYTLIQKAMASAERITELLEVEDGVPDPAPADAVPLPTPLRGDVRLDHVTFRYVEKAPPALDDVSLHVKPGETLAIVGATGSGKSTIANLVSRFWDPDQGSVQLDDIDLRRLPKRALRRRVALVLQDVFLFAGTIEENIALKPGPLSPEERQNVETAARAVAAHEVIERLGGYTAVVEERGATLSLGERQLISFARALAQSPSVLLLDEATASLDPETEQRLQAGVRALTQGRTAIVIAHRLATVKEAHQIAVLHHGRLKELGTHDELVRKGGHYADLVELQMGSEEPVGESRARSDRVPQA